MIKEDWNKRAKNFLVEHGWKEEREGMWCHESFPFAENLSYKNSFLKFTESFYANAWKAHRALIEGSNIIVRQRQEELKKNALVGSHE